LIGGFIHLLAFPNAYSVSMQPPVTRHFDHQVDCGHETEEEEIVVDCFNLFL
jgi:hypothetical protein